MAEWIREMIKYMLSTRNGLLIQSENKRIEKDLPCKHLSKGNSGYINTRLSRLQSKGIYQRQKRTLKVNPSRRFSTPRYVCLKQQSCKIWKELKGEKGK